MGNIQFLYPIIYYITLPLIINTSWVILLLMTFIVWLTTSFENSIMFSEVWKTCKVRGKCGSSQHPSSLFERFIRIVGFVIFHVVRPLVSRRRPPITAPRLPEKWKSCRKIWSFGDDFRLRRRVNIMRFLIDKPIFWITTYRAVFVILLV